MNTDLYQHSYNINLWKYELQKLLHAKREICKAKYDDADECILLSRQNMVNNEAKLFLKSHSNKIEATP